MPAAVIDGGMAAPGLISWVLTSNFADHVPLYRLEQIAARQSVALARSTLAVWILSDGDNHNSMIEGIRPDEIGRCGSLIAST